MTSDEDQTARDVEPGLVQSLSAKSTDGDESGDGEDGGDDTVIERRTKTQTKTKQPPML